jgi:hypothetical protein
VEGICFDGPLPKLDLASVKCGEIEFVIRRSVVMPVENTASHDIWCLVMAPPLENVQTEDLGTVEDA